jgi:chloride channel protein, CIC family
VSAQTLPPIEPPEAVAGPGTPRVRQVAVLCAIAIAVGLMAGLGASLFIKVEHSLQHFLWAELPERLGHATAPWWLVIVLLVTGALITFGATRLPGHAGHSPLDGFGLDIGPREILSVVIAALGSLSFGAVLGPEAPLMAVGTTLGALAFRSTANPARQVMMLAGGMAAVGAIFGNPLITAILLLEFAVVAGGAITSAPVLMAALGALAAGYSLQVGIGSWSGVGEAALGLPGLPAYPDVHLIDVACSVPLAAVVAVVAIAARLAGEEVDRVARRAPLPTLVGAGVVVALCAVAVQALTGEGLDLVLFSGQSAMPAYLGITSLATAAVVLVGKYVAYAASLGGGFRGGQIFPAIAIGALLATMCSLIVDGTSVAALAATAIAAATAAMIRLPFMATLLAVMLTYPAGGATTVTAIVGTLVGMLTRMVAEEHLPRLRPHQH